MKRDKRVSSSMEDYLEAIAVLKKKNKVARVKDISRMLNVETPSVTSALKTLTRDGLVIHERYGYIDLTGKGEKLAQSIQKRHEVLLTFLTDILDIDPETAAADACKMEHSISPETLRKLAKFVQFLASCQMDAGPDWLKGFGHHFKSGSRPACEMGQEREKDTTGE